MPLVSHRFFTGSHSIAFNKKKMHCINHEMQAANEKKKNERAVGGDVEFALTEVCLPSLVFRGISIN